MGYTKVNFEEAKQLLDSTPNHILLDVRDEEEYLGGHAHGAEWFPLDEITEESALEMVPDKTTLVLLYCRSGNRSKQAADLMLAYGYEHIYDMGGLLGWPYGID